MKGRLRAKETAVTIGLLLYLLFGLILYLEIPKYAIKIVEAEESIEEGRPLIVYSIEDIRKIKAQCRCWINCSCLLEKSNRLVENRKIAQNQVDVLIISPFDLKTIISHSITSTPCIITQPRKPWLSSIASYSLYEALQILRFVLEESLSVLVSECLSAENRNVVEYTRTGLCTVLIFAGIVCTLREVIGAISREKEKKKKSGLETDEINALQE
ncbi:hypothetical protein NEMIN01_0598 [Nematocida minor]|uniref:uncharacterized protein n=1 Tax=Nematocida minor TaxID=1912983 RepID=UPI00221FBD6D|nr:uncharacterized protein NEMIN01_0598 [Nematocida minor]KAI5189645.1 hypothetical protein NEMIN01_0598 [Nematocida minor]